VTRTVQANPPCFMKQFTGLIKYARRKELGIFLLKLLACLRNNTLGNMQEFCQL